MLPSLKIMLSDFRALRTGLMHVKWINAVRARRNMRTSSAQEVNAVNLEKPYYITQAASLPVAEPTTPAASRLRKA